MARRIEARIWPVWTENLAAMLEAQAIVRFVCMSCEKIYDVDLLAMAAIKGRGFKLLGARSRCKLSRCRGTGYFAVAMAPDRPFALLVERPELHTPNWLVGLCPKDVDPTPTSPPDAPPPVGVDPAAWADASVRERKRLVRIARG